MNDELFTLIDARGHAAGAALHRAAAVHPWTAKAPKRPIVWVRPALVVAAVVALLAGLVWVAHKPAPPAGHTPAGLRYVIGDMPAGWTLESTQDQSSTSLNGIVVASYGTYDDPTAPYVAIEWVDPARSSGTSLAGTSALNFYSNLREVAAGSATAVCGDKGSRTQAFCALDTPNGPLQVQASRATDAQIGQLLGAVEIVNGEPFVAAASVPAGMSTLAHGDVYAHPFLTWAQSNVGLTAAVYSNTSGDRGVTLATGWASDNDMAAAAAFAEMDQVDVGGHTGYLGTVQGPNLHELAWRDGERTFALTSDDGTLDLVALAASVRPATDTEWAAALVVRVPSGGPDGTSLTEGTDGTTPSPVPGTEPGASPETDPPASVPDGPIVTHDVAITQTVEPVSANDATYSCELPDGSFGSFQVAVAAGTVFMREPSGRSGSSSFKLAEKVSTTATFMDAGAGVAVVAISTDPAARQLRVTRSNGERYVLDLVPAEGHPDVHVGVVIIPDGTLVTFDVIDAEGKVLTVDPQLG